jgi:hypothetical protein
MKVEFNIRITFVQVMRISIKNALTASLLASPAHGRGGFFHGVANLPEH